MFGFIRMPHFLRRLIRRNTSHMAPERALEVKEKLSLLYSFVAWNIFGGIVYMIYTGRWKKLEKEETELSQARQFVKMLKMQNVSLHQIKGVTYIQKYDLNEEMAGEAEAAHEDKERCEE